MGEKAMISTTTKSSIHSSGVGSQSFAKMYTSETGTRLIAYAIDLALANAFLLPVLIKFGVFRYAHDEVKIPYSILFECFSLSFLYQVCFLFFLQATPGKFLMGLRVVNAHDEYLRLSIAQCFLRVFADQLRWFFGLAPRTLALLRYDRTHLSDWVAETRVVQFHPRSSVPHRRLIFGAVAFIVMATLSWMRAYHFIHNVSFFPNFLVFHP